MRDYINIGPCPAAENCVQIGDPDYYIKAKAECQRYIELIRCTLGPEPAGARLAIRRFPHDFGTYMEVVCYFDSDRPKSEEYAFKCESDAPGFWIQSPRVEGNTKNLFTSI
jgi:hypothetical protein